MKPATSTTAWLHYWTLIRDAVTDLSEVDGVSAVELRVLEGDALIEQTFLDAHDGNTTIRAQVG